MFARTERLLLRPGWAEDAPALADAIGEQAIVRNLASAPWPYGLKDAEAFLATERPAHTRSMLIFRRTHGAPQLAGSIGFGAGPEGEIEFGYWIARRYWGLGYATEAGRAVLDIARHSLRMKRLGAGHFVDNAASGRVLEKLGFRPTGHIIERFSAGRGETAPSKLFEIEFEEVSADPVTAMAA